MTSRAQQSGRFIEQGLRREYVSMGFLFGLVKAVGVFFAVVIAVLVVVDGTLLANLTGKRGG